MDLAHTENILSVVMALFDNFAGEMEHTCYAYPLSRRPGAHLSEEEVLTGTIIANMSQKSILLDRLKVLIQPDLAQIELSFLRQNLFTAFLA